MITTDILKRLYEIVGERNVLSSEEDLYLYSTDASWFSAKPDVAVRPHSAKEVSEILSLANSLGIPVIPRGAGSNLSGGVVPIKGGVVVDLAGMNRILLIDPTNLMCIVEPGVVHADLEAELAKYGLFWPPDPASTDAATMGGILAEGAGGMRGLKYGSTRDWVVGLEFVLPDGRIINTGSSTLKWASGYDLTRLFIRSEGTLGIITKAILKVRPLPESTARVAAYFDDAELVGKAVEAIFKAKIVPTIMEFIDREIIKAVNAYKKLGIPEAEALLIIDVDGTVEECNKLASKLESILRGIGAFNVKRARTKEEADTLYMARKVAIPAGASLRPTTIVEDLCVPITSLPKMLKAIREISAKYSTPMPTLGHVGDGNLHPLICTDKRNKEMWEKAMKAYEEICLSALKLEGTLSGEHGIALARKSFLPLECGNTALEIMVKIKHAIDPNNIMNPGKIFESSVWDNGHK